MDNASDIQAMAAALAERGLPVPAEQVASDIAAITGEPAPASTTAPRPAPAPAAPGAVDPIDAALFAPPATPDAYRFDSVPEGLTVDVAQGAEVARAFHSLGVAPEIAKHLDKLHSAALLAPPSADALEATRQATVQQLRRDFGDQADEVLAVARREFDSIAASHPKLAAMAKRAGLVNSYYLVATLHANARAKGRA